MGGKKKTDGKKTYPTPSGWPSRGKNLWESRNRGKRPVVFDSPESLWEACVEYFRWVEENPLYAAESVKHQGEASIIAVPKMRIMTVSGLVLFLGISRSTWYNYKNRPEFEEVCNTVESVMEDQKLAGAAADLLNANIIGRLLGLVDKQNIESHQNINGNFRWEIEIVDPGGEHEK